MDRAEASAERRQAKLTEPKNTTAAFSRDGRLHLLRSALFCAERRRPDLRTNRPAGPLAAERLGRVAGDACRAHGAACRAVDDQADLRAPVRLRAVVRLAPAQLSAARKRPRRAEPAYARLRATLAGSQWMLLALL